MSWRHWSWLKDGALPLAMVVLRFCWLWPWLAFAQRVLSPSYRGTLLPTWLAFGLLLGGVAGTRWALRRANALTQARIGVTGIGLAIVFLALWWQFYRSQYPLWDVRWVHALGQALTDWGDAVPPPLIALLATAYLWLRGVQDGHKRPLIRQDFWRACTAGGIALVVLILASLVDKGELAEGTGNLVLLFFATGLAALALSSLEMASQSAGHQFDAQLRLDRYWLGSIASVIVALLGLGLLLGALIAPETVAQLLNGIWVVVRQGLLFVIVIVSLVLYPILYLLSIVLPPLLQRLFESFNAVPLFMPRLFEPLGPGGQSGGEAVSILEPIPEGFRWVGLAVLLLVIAWAFARALRRLSAREGEKEVEEVRELILSRDLLQKQLAKLWREWLSWLQQRRKPGPSAFLPLEGEPPTRRAVRAVYQSLLSAAREHELPRLSHQTPIEYRRKLEAELPPGGNALGIITEGYMQARYDSEPPTIDQAERTLQAWEQLKSALEPQDGDKTV